MLRPMWLVLGACCYAIALQSVAQEDPLAPAIAAFQHGDLSSAEMLLESRVAAAPRDGEALGLLGMVLDQQKKYSAADEIYRRALLNSPPDPALLNNFGNHLLATGKPAQARQSFLKAVALDPHNTNALVQLARIALQQSSPAEALAYLDRAPAEAQQRLDARILKMQADYAAHRQQAGDALLSSLATHAADASQTYALGVALASVRQYDQAERFFSKSLELAPSNFDTLHNLGLAAAHAGHRERARTVLQEALTQQPDNVDVLYDLAAVDAGLDDKESALKLLAKAVRIAPQRSDVLQLTARTSAALGFFADAIHFWDQYLRLVPRDPDALRERAFDQTAIGEHTATALAELKAFIAQHPKDAIGHFELGLAETTQAPEHALQELNRAVSSNPDLNGPHLARGLLLYRQGQFAPALADFQFAAAKESQNGAILDRLGQAYLATERVNDALPVLRRAAELSPSNPTVLLHLARALSKAGQRDEAARAFARCRELGPDRSTHPHSAGLVDFLALSASEQRARYKAGLERSVQSNAADANAQLQYLNLLLEDQDLTGAASVVHTLSTSKPPPAVLKQAARLLLAAAQYSLLEQLPENGIYHAIADFHVSGPEAGLSTLEKLSPTQRNGDYELARALLLEALNRKPDAELAIHSALEKGFTEPELCRQAALLLLHHYRSAEAEALLAQAVKIAPDDSATLLLHALVSELSGRHEQTDRELEQLENRWPDWFKPWFANALVLESRGQSAAAETMRQTALALGAPVDLLALLTPPVDFIAAAGRLL